MVPTTPAEWYNGLPLKQVDMSWRDYMTANWNNPSAESFLSFQDGPNVHELAHLIRARDEHVWDPFWGQPFLKPFDSEGFGSRTELMGEVEVFAIQFAIEAFWERHDGSDWEYPWVPNPDDIATAISRDARKQLGIPRRSVRAYAQECLGRWPIEKCWAELVRKKRFIDEQILSM